MEMKEFQDDCTNMKTIVDDEKITIEIPISTLVFSFKYYPNGIDGQKVITGEERAFAEIVAKHLHDEIDQETGASHITQMTDGLFEYICDGSIEMGKTVNWPDED
jgi:hypothetical protein